ncbi:MAG TPA: 30S ribosomal protein S20 [Candidatus Colwellbacteria bacterium]|nr:30S ribosomal protein S20 [Candidatus Colwellbacteria bacterium]
MPIIKSAKKALRKSEKRREINAGKKETLLKAIKQHRKLIAAGKIEEAKKYLPSLYKTLDKAAKANLIKQNKSSRLKSRLTQSMAKSVKTSS